MKCDIWKQCRDLIDRTSFDFRFEDFLRNLSKLLKIVTYRVTDQPSIIWSWRSVLNFNLSVFTFLRSRVDESDKLLDDRWVKIVESERNITLIYVQCNNTLLVRNSGIAVRNSGISFLALILNLSKPERQILHAKLESRLRDVTSHIPFFSVDQYELRLTKLSG